MVSGPARAAHPACPHRETYAGRAKCGRLRCRHDLPGWLQGRTVREEIGRGYKRLRKARLEGRRLEPGDADRTRAGVAHSPQDAERRPMPARTRRANAVKSACGRRWNTPLRIRRPQSVFRRPAGVALARRRYRRASVSSECGAAGYKRSHEVFAGLRSPGSALATCQRETGRTAAGSLRSSERAS